MTRLERLQDGLGSADDALGLIREFIAHGKLPPEDQVELCIDQLAFARATLKGALTISVDRHAVEDPREHPPRSTAARHHAGSLTRAPRGRLPYRDPPDD